MAQSAAGQWNSLSWFLSKKYFIDLSANSCNFSLSSSSIYFISPRITSLEQSYEDKHNFTSKHWILEFLWQANYNSKNIQTLIKIYESNIMIWFIYVLYPILSIHQMSGS